MLEKDAITITTDRKLGSNGPVERMTLEIKLPHNVISLRALIRLGVEQLAAEGFDEPGPIQQLGIGLLNAMDEATKEAPPIKVGDFLGTFYNEWCRVIEVGTDLRGVVVTTTGNHEFHPVSAYTQHVVGGQHTETN